MENIDSMFLENLEEWVLEEDKVCPSDKGNVCKKLKGYRIILN